MRYVPLMIVAGLLILSTGCAWTSAKSLSPEQLAGMESIMKIDGVSGCFGAGGGGSFASAEFQLRGAICKGMDPKANMDDLIRWMNGITVNVQSPR